MATTRREPHALSVVMPVFNEQDVIQTVVEAFAPILESFARPEFILVNDRSTDATPAILERLTTRYPYLRVINHERNLGNGPSQMDGYRAATGDYVFYCDSDNQFVTDDFWRLWDTMRENHLDLVVGDRKKRLDPLTRLVLTRLLQLFLRPLVGRHVRDGNCPFRIYRGAALRRMLGYLPPHPRVPSLLLVLAAYKLRLNIGWVGVRHLPRLTGTSNFRNLKLLRFSAAATKEVWQFNRRMNRVVKNESRATG